MKIGVAQTKSSKGCIEENILNHLGWIDLAVSEGTDLIVFPELSLTGYEPSLAEVLAIDQIDQRLDEFQRTSDLKKIIISVGLPTKSARGILISMVIFRPNESRQTYSKQWLHEDELPYFVEGNKQILIDIENMQIAPAICYESLVSEHVEKAVELGAELYLASVAKSEKVLIKARAHYSNIAQKYAMPILMSNCVGPCDEFIGAGQSAIWDQRGAIIGQLDDEGEGLLLLDVNTNRATKIRK